MTQPTSTARAAWWDVILPLLGVLLVLYVCVYGNQYAAGTRNDMNHVFGVGMSACFFGVPAMMLVTAGQLAWVMVSWQRRNNLARITGVGTLLTLPLAVVLIFALNGGQRSYMDGFVLWAKQNANAAMLQSHRPALVQAAAAQLAQSNQPYVDVPRNSWPAPITALQPSYVFVYPDQSIDLVWGGGFGHWGLYLHGNGPPQSVMLNNSLVWPVETGLDAWSGD